MDLRQLGYFVAVAEEGNFTRAAERVHISQSGISAQIRQLERELGTPLLDRSGRRVTLTAAGAGALGHARAALASAQAVRDAVDDVTALVRGGVAVGMVTACTVRPLFDGLAAYHRAHPGVELDLTEAASDHLIDGVRDGALDLALVGVADTMPPGLDGLEIIREGLALLVTDDHPLAGRRSVSLDDAVRHPLLCLPAGTGIRAVLDRSCAARGLEPDVALQASAPDAVVDLAERGLGAGVLSTSMAADFADRLRVVALRDLTVDALLGLVWSNRPSPALRALVRELRAAFPEPGDPAPPAATTPQETTP